MTELMLEIVPPSRMTSDNYKEKVMDKVSESVNSIKPDVINVPEIVDENFEGKPYYRNVSARRFAKKINELTGKKVIVNKVVVHCNGLNELQKWINKSVNELGLKDFVFVGGSSDKFSYPGPSVTEANNLAKSFSSINAGNIMIPSRENEAQRMLTKTLSGASFFTSQILFESEKTQKTLFEYNSLCIEKKIKPAKVYLSFCPVSGINELFFLRWLGVEMPEKTEKEIFSEEEKIPVNSINSAEKVWNKIITFSEKENLSIPLNLNIEEIFLHNLDSCIELALRLRQA
ncbi:hypothetical protein KKG83_01965 [Candidatus Micrarchaeota archaeon]|nr:hypothetical protein [Candidatus Micrarchaeota archaeon]MBU2476216.1 hypothetical protein [Candidatus Micrarchaeota archaeon]